MKLSSGKRIGQSGQELATAVSFSLLLHVVFFFATVFLYFTVTPRIYTPPFYQVKLVGQPVESALPPQALSTAVKPAAPRKEEKALPKQKEKKGSQRKAGAQNKNGLPDLATPKKKQALPEQEQPQASTAQSPDAAAGIPGPKSESVEVAAVQQDFKFGWYLVRIRDKIGHNWNPPPDAKEAKARVIFSINRSGWVGEVNLVPDQSNGTFGFKQAAIRAIRSSNPFPPLPEEFSKQTLEFTVDLTAIE